MEIAEHIRKLAAQSRYHFTLHATQRCLERGLTLQAVISALASHVEVIEDYPDDPRGHSCLVLTFEAGQRDRPLHVNVGLSDPDRIVIIAVYCPALSEWESDYKTRKKGGN